VFTSSRLNTDQMKLLIMNVKKFLLRFFNFFGTLLTLLPFFLKTFFFYFLKMCTENLTKNFEKRALLKPQKRTDIVVIVV